MVKDEKAGRKGERKLVVLIALACNYASQFKLILFTLLLLLFSTFLAFLHFLPSYSYLPPVSCITAPPTTVAPKSQHPLTDEILQNGVVKRRFHPFGAAAYSFILMSAYRGGPTTFAIIGLSSKPLHVFSRPTYTCEYQTQNSTSSSSSSTYFTKASRILPDWGFGRVYTVVIINCTFGDGTNNPSTGGRLLLHTPSPVNHNSTDTFVALDEQPFSWEPSLFLSPPKYDFLYCGSPLYGNLSPQRMREWIAYHVRLFGKRSHFVIYDAGGVHPEVMEVLKPWKELGFITLQDVEEEERFDGYYHNQFLIVNDCLHRYRFDTKWMFFFDVDEYIYVPPKLSLRSVVDSLRDYTQFTIEQIPISNQLCLSQDAGQTSKYVHFSSLILFQIICVATLKTQIGVFLC